MILRCLSIERRICSWSCSKRAVQDCFDTSLVTIQRQASCFFVHYSLRLYNKTKRNIFIRSVRLIRIALNNGYALIFQYALKRQVRLKTRVYGIL